MQVLDKGFVELIDHMGSDLRVVNSARISFGKRKEVFDERDAGLIDYLAEHGHETPFRSCQVCLHIKAPIFVMRQWMRYNVGCSWNEISRRYVDTDPEFHTPTEWRTQSKNIKQGSDGVLTMADCIRADRVYRKSCMVSVEAYFDMLELGVAKEQAREVLPLSLFVAMVVPK